jgi:FdhD protein
MSQGSGGDRHRKAVARRERVRLADGAADASLDEVVVEEPLEIRVDGETVAVTMRTPGQDADLALGFLLAEGILSGAADVGSAAHCGRPGAEGYGNVIDVRSAGGMRIDPDRVLEGRRWNVTSASCGVCGRRSVAGLLERVGRVEVPTRLSEAAVHGCIAQLQRAQPIFDRTGGLHAAALFSAEGKLLAAAEDVGRHNAVDKVVGSLLRRGLVGRAPASQGQAGPGEGAGSRVPALLAVSGRTSFEIVQKAAAAKVPFVASVSAPSSLAVDLAGQAGIALLGFVRSGRLNVYASAWRLERQASAPGSRGSEEPWPSPRSP